MVKGKFLRGAILAAGLAAIVPATLSGQGRREGGEEVGAGVFVYQFIQNSVPLSFSVHDVMYETLYQDNVISPVNFACRVLGPRAGKPYERAAVIPGDIQVGIHRLSPVEISRQAFAQTGIKSIDIRAAIRTIPQSAFMYCTELESVAFHGNAPHFIEAAAFQGCTKLKSIEGLPAQLKYIGDHAFHQCSSLSEIYIPKDVAYLGEYAFYYCHSLSKVKFATGHFRRIPRECFRDCGKLTEIEIPEGVEALDENAFYYAGLESITLPGTMRALYNGCLSQTPLKHIYLHATTPPGVGKVFTQNMIDNITLHVPAGSIDRYRNDPFWKLFKNIVAL